MKKFEIFFRKDKYRMAEIFIFIGLFLYLGTSGMSVNSGYINMANMVSINIGILIFCLFGLFRKDKKLISFGLMILLGYNFINYSNQAFSNFNSISAYFSDKGIYAFAELFEAFAILIFAICLFWMLYSYFVQESRNYEILVILYVVALAFIVISLAFNVAYYSQYATSKYTIAYVLGRLSMITMFLSYIYMFFCLDNRMTPSNVNYNDAYYS